MPPTDRSQIVADGRWRILSGSAREEASGLRTRLTRRAAPIVAQASAIERAVIRFRIWRFAQRQIARRAPREALYSSPRLSFTHSSADSRVHRAATRNI